MLALTNDILSLLEKSLSSPGRPAKIYSIQLIPLDDQNYLCCWSTLKTCGTKYIYQMQVIKTLNGTILFCKGKLPCMYGKFPKLVGLQKELVYDWVADNIKTLIRIANDILELKQEALIRRTG